MKTASMRSIVSLSNAITKTIFSITETIEVYDKLQNELRWYIDMYICVYRITIYQEEFIPKDSKYNRYLSAQIMSIKTGNFNYGLLLSEKS